MTMEDKEQKTHTVIYNDGIMIVPDKIPIDMVKSFFAKFVGTPTKEEYLEWKKDNKLE